VNLLKRKIDNGSDQNAEAKRQRMRSEQNKMKSDKEKQKRFNVRTQETVKMLTNCKCDFVELEKEKKKIPAEKIDINCVLTPRFHLDTVQFLMDNQFFEEDAINIVNEFLVKMKNRKQDVKEKNVKVNERTKKKECQQSLFNFFSSQS
jgi:hypothetical protein